MNSKFFDKLSMRSELAFLSFFLCADKTKWLEFVTWIVILKYQFFNKNLNLKKNYAKIEQTHAKYPVFAQNYNPRQLLKKNSKRQLL